MTPCPMMIRGRPPGRRAPARRSRHRQPRTRQVPLGLKQVGEVVEALRGVGMFGAERLLADRQRALIKRPRAGKVALSLKQVGEVGEVRRNFGVLVAECFFVDRQRALEQRPRAREVAFPAVARITAARLRRAACHLRRARRSRRRSQFASSVCVIGRTAFLVVASWFRPSDPPINVLPPSGPTRSPRRSRARCVAPIQRSPGLRRAACRRRERTASRRLSRSSFGRPSSSSRENPSSAIAASVVSGGSSSRAERTAQVSW